MAAFKECNSNEDTFWSAYSVIDKRSGSMRRMRWTEIWRRVQQVRKDRDRPDHAAMMQAHPDAADRASFLTYKNSGKTHVMKTVASKARKWREMHKKLLPYDLNDSEDNDDES